MDWNCFFQPNCFDGIIFFADVFFQNSFDRFLRCLYEYQPETQNGLPQFWVHRKTGNLLQDKSADTSLPQAIRGQMALYRLKQLEKFCSDCTSTPLGFVFANDTSAATADGIATDTHDYLHHNRALATDKKRLCVVTGDSNELNYIYFTLNDCAAVISRQAVRGKNVIAVSIDAQGEMNADFLKTKTDMDVLPLDYSTMSPSQIVSSETKRKTRQYNLYLANCRNNVPTKRALLWLEKGARPSYINADTHTVSFEYSSRATLVRLDENAFLAYCLLLPTLVYKFTGAQRNIVQGQSRGINPGPIFHWVYHQLMHATNRSYLPAQYAVATLLLRDTCVFAHDFAHAQKLLSLCATREYVPAMALLGNLYVNHTVYHTAFLDAAGLANPESATQAGIVLLEHAAQKGSSLAQYRLGKYFCCEATPPDYDIGITHLEQAAADNHKPSKKLLTQMLHERNASGDTAQALLWEESLLAPDGQIEQRYQLALALKELASTSHSADILRILKHCHAAGLADASNLLGLSALHGELQPQSDEDALCYFTQGANGGNACSCQQLSLLYQNTQKPFCNLSKAYEYGKQAAEKGVQDAYLFVGECLYCGSCTEKDDAAAKHWLEKILPDSPQYPDAQLLVSRIYHWGLTNVPQDRARAKSILQQLVARNFLQAQEILTAINHNQEAYDTRFVRIWCTHHLESHPARANTILGELRLPTSPEQALSYLQAGAQHGELQAILLLAKHHDRANNPTASLHYYNQAYAQDSRVACYEHALLLWNQENRTEAQARNAVDILQHAPNNRTAQAQYLNALMYTYFRQQKPAEHQFPLDAELACYRTAADSGIPQAGHASFALAQLLRDYHCDTENANHYLTRAHKLGFSEFAGNGRNV